ncbi:PRC-barrel domain-containing protein [Streptomyces sp. NBC_01537]|uniref:PRC-barrel domain-containing protein n=1 Tax=Streptomyces sp. NBC_01537 TaxID=2903896 RepID=UPI0038677035
MTDGVWDYQEESGHKAGTDLTGFKVEARDGSIGKVDKHSEDVGAAHIVVDTGMWIFGKHVLLPVGTISSIDVAEQRIHVDRTKEEIKDSPEFDKDRHTGDAGYHERVAGYYGTPHA